MASSDGSIWWCGESGNVPVCFDADKVNREMEKVKKLLNDYRIHVGSMKVRADYLKGIKMGKAAVISNGKMWHGQKVYKVTVYDYPLNEPIFRFNEDGRPVVKTPDGDVDAHLPFGESTSFSDFATAKEYAKELAERLSGIVVREKAKKTVKE
jgi:hypothetical protein